MDIINTVVCNHIVGNPPVAYIQEYCPRCQGKGYYGCITFSPQGGINFCSGVTQLVQQIKKIFTERRRTTGYGLDYTLLSGVIDDTKLIAIQNEIIRCLSYYKKIQQQDKLNNFYYNPDEEISSIDTPTLIQDSTDPRKVTISVNVYSVSGVSANVTVPVVK